MRAYPKKIKRLLREYTIEAYERELHRELTKVAASFTEWHKGALSSDELSHRVHEYDTGPSRRLYTRYNDGDDDMNVAYAIVVGTLNRDELSPELLEAIAAPLSLYRSMKKRGELREPE